MVRPPWHPPQPSSQEVVGALGYNQELGLCIEFGPVRDDSVHWGGGLRRFTPSWTSTRVTCDCLLPFVHPLLAQVVM